MKIENNKLVLETTKCHVCLDSNPGFVAGRKRCPKCNGTRKGPRGGRNKCPCYDGTVPDFINLKQCSVCNGTNIVPETITDYAPDALWQGLTFKVIRDENGRFGFNEAYLGYGYVFTCQDYGSAWQANDDAKLLADVKGHKSHQACKFAKDDGTLCEYIAILVSKQGYKVKAMYSTTDAAADASQIDATVKGMFDPKGLAVAEAMVRNGG